MSQVTVGMTVGTQPPLGQIKASVLLAKAFGFDTLWTVDHFVSFWPRSVWDKDFSWLASGDSSPDEYFDYQVLLGWLARKAGRLRVAVGVTEPARRHPVLIAQAFLTLSHLTKRPPILGIGAGEAENIVPYGIAFDTPVARLEESLEIIATCFDSSAPFSFEGDHFQLDRASMDVQPGKGGRPEIWVAAHGPRMLRLTGEYGDGWYPTLPITPADYESSLKTIAAAARHRSRSMDGFTPAYQAFCVLGATESAAREMLTTRAVRYATLLAPAYVWQRHGVEHPLGPAFRGMIDIIPTRLDRREVEDAMAKVPIDLLANTLLWGTPDKVRAGLADLVDAGMRHVVMAPVSALISRSAALFALRSMIKIGRSLRTIQVV